MKNLSRKIRDANLKVFQSKNFDVYDKNESIFEDSRQRDIKSVLSRGTGTLLDIGCGTGNILRLGKDWFKRTIGLDVSHSFLRELHIRHGFKELAVGEADLLPIKSESIDFVSCYALLHHLFDHKNLFQEAYRVLKKGGILYTDHDPNYFFARFYSFYYRLRYLSKPGFENEETEISEWHNTRSSGLNPQFLEKQMYGAGFAKVQIGYRLTTNPGLGRMFKLARTIMKGTSKVIPAKSLHTHFYIIATK